MNLLFVRISVERKRDCTQTRARPRPSRVTAIAVGCVGLVAAMTALPAAASTTGSNSSTVGLSPPPVRSITVSPTTSSFGGCGGDTESDITFPNGQCTVGVQNQTTGAITGGITITNGTEAGHIDVNGQNATPSDVSGTPWTLVSGGVPGADQFREDTIGTSWPTLGNLNSTNLGSAPVCDTAFTTNTAVTAGDCTATAGQSANEALLILGPSSSTDQNGPFTITTTWTAVP